ncbi:hypothetical protein B5S28_g907 [[Candida] boidinii]|nr:hypothetical protein B5S28_g907 [[Candida] boidinii]OWB72371.1 hypothetical protein B5S31_g2079 [[Candida] boidinii]
MSIPSIDFSPIYSEDKEAIKELVNQVRNACLDKGFFQLVGHHVEPSLQENMLNYSSKFFKLSPEDKLKVSKLNNSYNRGYETVGSQSFEKDQTPDIKEGIYFGGEIPLDHPLFGKINCGPNQWPELIEGSKEEAENFQKAVMDYREQVLKLGTLVLKVIALGLGCDETFFNEFLVDPIAIVRLLHYPKKDFVSESDRGIGAHTDFGAITLLLQGEVSGLQVMEEETGEWIDIPPNQGAYVVNLGDMMQMWSNDKYHSNIHRVMNIPGKERFSIPFFINGNPNFEIKCLPSCEDEDGSAKYPVVTVNDYIQRKYDQSYNLAIATPSNASDIISTQPVKKVGITA